MGTICHWAQPAMEGWGRGWGVREQRRDRNRGEERTLRRKRNAVGRGDGEE